MKKLILGISLVLLTSNALACEKWKGEMTKLAWESGKYYKLYNNYQGGNLEKALFLVEAQEIVSEISQLSEYIDSTESCNEDKFHKRKERLVDYIGKARSLMRVGQLVYAFKKEPVN